MTRTFTLPAEAPSGGWVNVTDIELVAITQWRFERVPLAGVNGRKATAAFRGDASVSWGPETRFYLDNVGTELRNPGEWYQDRSRGLITYLPLDGETLDSVRLEAPLSESLVTIDNVEHQQFENVTFTGSSWSPIDIKDHDGQIPQGGALVPAAVSLRRSRDIGFAGCSWTGTGGSALFIGEGTVDVRVQKCQFESVGGVGITASSESGLAREGSRTGISTSRISVADSTFDGGGRIFHDSCAILAMDVRDCEFVRNEIIGSFYTGISLGWSWVLSETGFGGFVVEKNHIHDIGRGVMADLGGVYTLGHMPQSRIINNHVHHVLGSDSPSVGIYFDQGSSEIECVDNLVHDCVEGIWAPSATSGISVMNNIASQNVRFQVGVGGGPGDASQGSSPVVERNIILSSGARLFRLPSSPIGSNRNLLWDYRGPIESAGDRQIRVSLRSADDGREIASVTGNFLGEEGFKFARLLKPLALNAQRSYLLTMSIEAGSPSWVGEAPLRPLGPVRLEGDVFRGVEGRFQRSAAPGAGLGPVNLLYREGDMERSLIGLAGSNNLPRRTDHSGDVGFRFHTARPLEVVALGVWALRPVWWAEWRGAGRDRDSVITDPGFVDAPGGRYQLPRGLPSSASALGIREVGTNFGPE